jgi:hypothetical protein
MIEPGKSEDVKVKMVAAAKGGPFQKTIDVLTNDRDHATVKLECAAEVLSALKFEPDTLNFGMLRRSDPTLVRTVRVMRGSGVPIKPKVLAVTNPQVAAELNEVQPGDVYELTVTAQQPWPKGNLFAAVQLETGVEQAPHDNLMVSGMVAPRVEPNPSRFLLRPNMSSDTELVARLVWDGDPPAKITAATVSDAGLTAHAQEQEGQEVVVLDVPAGYVLPKDKSVRVMVNTDDPVAPVIQIPVVPLSSSERATGKGAGSRVRKGQPPAPTAALTPSATAAPPPNDQSPTSAPAEEARAK